MTETKYDRQIRWAEVVYGDTHFGECDLCEVAGESKTIRVLCPVCGFCLKYHCKCEAL